MRIGEATNQKDLLNALHSEKNYRLELRRGHETIWWNNLALLSGDHYAQWDWTTGQFREELKPRHRVRLVLNHALTVARTEFAKLVKSRPIMDVIADDDTEESIQAARVGAKVLEGAEWKFDLRQIRKKALWWTLATGNSAMYVGWDPDDAAEGNLEFVIHPDTGEPVFDPVQKNQIMDQYNQGQLQNEPVERPPLGDVCFKVYSPFQLLPDPAVLNWDEIKDLITVDVVNIDVADSMWGKGVAKLGPDSNTTLGTVERRALARIFMQSYRNPSVQDAIQIYTYWLLPNVYRQNRYLKDGLMIRWCKDAHLLEVSKPFPYEDGDMPFSFLEHIPNNMSIWAESILQHIRGPNLEMDKTASQLIENKDYVCNPMWLKAAQHQIKGQIKNVPGGELTYNHVPNIPPPQRIEGAPLPVQVENILINLRDQILDISGQGETSRGRTPSGVRSGVQVAYLQEEDETRLGPTLENLEDFIARMGSLTLRRMGQYYTIERLVRNYKPDGQHEVVKFKGADLKGNTNVICIAGSAFPKSKAARQQNVLDMVQLGIEVDPKRVRDLLEIGGSEPDEIDMAYAQAGRENVMMQQTDLPQTPNGGTVRLWQKHEAHLKKHYQFMTSTDYEQMIQGDPTIDQRFTQHTTEHEQALQMQQFQQMQMLMAAKGAPGQGNGPNPNPANQQRPDSYRNVGETGP